MTCAAKVGLNTAWLAGGDRQLAQVTVVECVTPNPIVLECFQVNSTRITDVLYVPPAALTQNEATLTATMKRVSMRSTLQRAGSLTSIPPHMATVWLGAQCGKYVIMIIFCQATEATLAFHWVILSWELTYLFM